MGYGETANLPGKTDENLPVDHRLDHGLLKVVAAWPQLSPVDRARLLAVIPRGVQLFEETPGITGANETESETGVKNGAFAEIDPATLSEALLQLPKEVLAQVLVGLATKARAEQ